MTQLTSRPGEPLPPKICPDCRTSELTYGRKVRCQACAVVRIVNQQFAPGQEKEE
jgi:hypothetical protein